MSDEDDFVRITLRIPKDVHRQLNEAAGGKRSMNAEIIARLEESFDPTERLKDTEVANIIEKTVQRVIADIEKFRDGVPKIGYRPKAKRDDSDLI